MAQETTKEALLGALCASTRGFVTYVPLRTEVSFRERFPIQAGAPEYEILPRGSLDPGIEVAQAVRTLSGLPVAILMPGRRFDVFGTRLGQGGGWYDRFLSVAPVEWLRVGFCFSDQFSPTPLVRMPHDEPVDVVCVVERTTGALSVLETRARMPAFLEN